MRPSNFLQKESKASAFQFFPLWCLPLFLFLSLLNSSLAHSTVVTVKQIQCAYDPASGKPNPFGSRAFITVTQNGADTTFRYESFPALLQLPDLENTHKPRAVTSESTRTMVFYNTQIEIARELMRKRSDYYFELVGFEDKVGFVAYDEVMSCE